MISAVAPLIWSGYHEREVRQGGTERLKAEDLIGNRYEGARWERLKKSKDEISSVEGQKGESEKAET